MATNCSTFEKSIQYDRETRDYAMFFDGEFVGYAANYHAAENALNTLAYEKLIHGDFATATDLDGSQDDDTSPYDDLPTDAPGTDCPDHGPTDQDECPQCSRYAAFDALPVTARARALSRLDEHQFRTFLTGYAAWLQVAA